MIGFSLMLGCLGSNYFPLQREIMVRHQPNTKIHICIHVGAHRYYVKTIWKRTKDIEKRLLIFLNPTCSNTEGDFKLQRWI